MSKSCLNVLLGRGVGQAGWLLCSCKTSCLCCRQTHVQGLGALQHVASLSKATSRRAAREGVQINLSGWPAAPRKPPSLWKMRALFQDLPSGGWNLLWTGSLPQECCLRGGSGVCCAPAIGSRMCQGPRAPAEAWPRLLSAHQSDGSVSAHQHGGISALLHSGLRSQPAKIPRAASNRQRIPLFCRNAHSLEIRCCL